MTGYLWGLAIVFCFNVLAAYSVYLPLAAGQLNLGIAGFMAIGAYTAAVLTNEAGWAVPWAVLAGAAAAGVVAAALAIPVMRTKGVYLALATFALGQVIAAVFLNLDVVGGAAGYPVIAYAGPAWVIAATVMVVLVMVYLSRTRLCLYLTAIKNDTVVSDLMGMNVKAIQVTAFTIGAAVAGLGGGLYGHHYSYVEAQHFSVLLSVFTVLYVLMGGTQTVWGPLVGALFFTAIPELLRSSEQWRFAIFAVFIIVFMAWRPQGLITSTMLARLRAKKGETP